MYKVWPGWLLVALKTCQPLALPGQSAQIGSKGWNDRESYPVDAASHLLLLVSETMYFPNASLHL